MQSELLSDLYSVTWDEPPSDEVVHGDQASRYPWADAEVAFAMRWTRVAAGGRLEDARRLIEDLPRVHAALCAGDIDMPKAMLIAPGPHPLLDAVVELIMERSRIQHHGKSGEDINPHAITTRTNANRGLQLLSAGSIGLNR
jgi:hypothetical protein